MASQGFHEESNTFESTMEEADVNEWYIQRTEKANHDEEIEHAWENADKLLDYYLH